jgi:hypothetical protein
MLGVWYDVVEVTRMVETYTIDDIKRVSIPVARKYGVKKLALFGSYARGEQKDGSDIDFLIEKGEIQDLFVFCGFVNALEDSLGRRVDVLTYDALKDSFIAGSVGDEVVLYER